MIQRITTYHTACHRIVQHVRCHRHGPLHSSPKWYTGGKALDEHAETTTAMHAAKYPPGICRIEEPKGKGWVISTPVDSAKQTNIHSMHAAIDRNSVCRIEWRWVISASRPLGGGVVVLDQRKKRAKHPAECLGWQKKVKEGKVKVPTADCPLAPASARIPHQFGRNRQCTHFFFVFAEVIFRSRVIGACPVTTDCIVATG